MRLVLLRHGESVWNKENRFTGWTDVDLSENGVKEAENAGKLLKEKGFTFDVSFTSVLKRANRTLEIVLKEMNLNIPVNYSYRLNDLEFLRNMKSVLIKKYRVNYLLVEEFK